jgi:hypothetical protein
MVPDSSTMHPTLTYSQNPVIIPAPTNKIPIGQSPMANRVTVDMAKKAVTSINIRNQQKPSLASVTRNTSQTKKMPLLGVSIVSEGLCDEHSRTSSMFDGFDIFPSSLRDLSTVKIKGE